MKRSCHGCRSRRRTWTGRRRNHSPVAGRRPRRRPPVMTRCRRRRAITRVWTTKTGWSPSSSMARRSTTSAPLISRSAGSRQPQRERLGPHLPHRRVHERQVGEPKPGPRLVGSDQEQRPATRGTRTCAATADATRATGRRRSRRSRWLASAPAARRASGWSAPPPRLPSWPSRAPSPEGRCRSCRRR